MDVSGGMVFDFYMVLIGGVLEDINLREFNMEFD